MSKVTPKLYFHWLCAQVYIPEDESRWDLLGEIHRKQFTWSVPNDDNREMDALELRASFLRENGTKASDSTVVSMLEVIVALSQRLAFDDERWPPSRWAWRLIENLGLDQDRFLDPLYNEEIDMISDILDRLIWRQYEPNGQGGFFPLAFPSQDQTKVEIWYQMSSYLEEQHPDHG